jgi:hypothetical protein
MSAGMFHLKVIILVFSSSDWLICNEEFHNLCAAPNVSVNKLRTVLFARTYSMVEIRTEDIVLVRKPKGKRSLGIPRHTW